LAALLAGFLRDLSPDEIPPAVRLVIGQVFPEWEARALNVSWQAVMVVIDGLTRPYITATATDRDGNASEFSTPQKAWARIYLPAILKSE
jgi:hypothetical protein